MNIPTVKQQFCFVLMIGLLIMALMTTDVISSKLFASLSIVTGAFTFSNQSDITKIM